MMILGAILLAISLCADCFAVSTCSSVTLDSISWRKVAPIAMAFGVIQSLLMLVGWAFADLFVGYVEKAADVIGFLLLLYVGGSMIVEAFSDESEVRDLNGLRNVIVGGVATSIDAFAVGISLSMGKTPHAEVAADIVAVLFVTILSVIAGMFWGQRIGRRFGRVAEVMGGAVLIFIGLNILFDFI